MKKTVFLLMLAALIIAASIAISNNAHATESRTMDEVKAWLDNEAAMQNPYGNGWCTYFCNHYLVDFWGEDGIYGVGNANGWVGHCPSNWKDFDVGGNPDNFRMGDLIVEYIPPTSDEPDNTGHVMVYYGKGDDGRHYVLDQNFNGHLYTTKHIWYSPLSQVTYCYRPPITSASSSNAGEPFPDLFSHIPPKYSFTAGAYGWCTTIEIRDDGTFEGAYADIDYDSDDSVGYSSILYYSSFHGKFKEPRKINRYTYSFLLDFLEYDCEVGKESIELVDGKYQRVIYTSAYGIEGTKTFNIYTKGAPVSKLPESFVWSISFASGLGDAQNLPFYGLYCVEPENGFFQTGEWNETATPKPTKTPKPTATPTPTPKPTPESFQHTIKSDPNDNRDFTFNINEEVEDLVFSTKASEYNPRLAHFLACMARAAYSPDQLRDNYIQLGFSEPKFRHYEQDWGDFEYEDHYAGVAIGQKRLDDGSLMVFITIRGTHFGTSEALLTDFYDKGLTENRLEPAVGLHTGFYNCEEQLYDDLYEYFGDEIPTENVTYVITGHSLGAAVGNLISLRLFKKGVPTDSLYNYNFACPLVGAGTDDASLWNFHGLHNNIINICNKFDKVPSMPNETDYAFWELWSYGANGWTSFKRFGASYWFDNGFANWYDAHDMKAYIDYLARELDKSHFVSTEYYVDMISVHCPVDVVILNGSGNPIAGTENNVPNYYGYPEGEKAIITVNGDQKTFRIVGEDKLEVRFRATDEGEMEYLYCRRGMIGENTLVYKGFSPVQLTEGKEMVSFVGGDMSADDIKLFVVDGDGYSAEILEDGTEKTLKAEDPEQQPTGSPVPTETAAPEEPAEEGTERDRKINPLMIAIPTAAALLIALIAIAVINKHAAARK